MPPNWETRSESKSHRCKKANKKGTPSKTRLQLIHINKHNQNLEILVTKNHSLDVLNLSWIFLSFHLKIHEPPIPHLRNSPEESNPPPPVNTWIKWPRPPSNKRLPTLRVSRESMETLPYFTSRLSLKLQYLQCLRIAISYFVGF